MIEFIILVPVTAGSGGKMFNELLNPFMPVAPEDGWLCRMVLLMLLILDF